MAGPYGKIDQDIRKRSGEDRSVSLWVEDKMKKMKNCHLQVSY